MSELEYGPVYVFGGRHKGRILYYDDDHTSKTAICYVGHPLSFCGNYDVPVRFLREPTIDDLLKRREELWRLLSDIAIEQMWDIEPRELNAIWAERSLVDDTLHYRRMFGELGQLEGKSVFLCHSSVDKGMVRMVHDDLMHLGVNCWLDENKIKVGDSIVATVSDGLASSQTMIVFLSPESVGSMWTRKEWQSFLARQLSGNAIKILLHCWKTVTSLQFYRILSMQTLEMDIMMDLSKFITRSSEPHSHSIVPGGFEVTS
jgi:hypothetical protein